MIYSKLPVVFLNTIASEKQGSTNGEIASYIITHLDEVKYMGIAQLAQSCHVANSSISRFVKDIGLKNYNELRELMLSASLHFECEDSLGSYTTHLQHAINDVYQTINHHEIDKLCQKIKTYKKIAAFGLLKAETAAMNFVDEMMMLGKPIYTNVSYFEQIDYILHASEEDLIIIFSYTGAYFDYPGLRSDLKKLKKPHIVFISSTCDQYPDFINQVIDFHSDGSLVGHPYTLMLVGSYISQVYAKG